MDEGLLVASSKAEDWPGDATSVLWGQPLKIIRKYSAKKRPAPWILFLTPAPRTHAAQDTQSGRQGGDKCKLMRPKAPKCEGQVWETSVGDKCGRQVWETSVGDKWKTSVNSCGPRHPEWETRGRQGGDKGETRGRQGGDKGETRGRQV